jgi:hypothetical protein
MTKNEFIKEYNLTEAQFIGTEQIEGSLYLSSLTSIPKGFNPIVGGSLYLDSLTSIPEGFNPTVGGSLDLESLTSIPEGFNPTVGGGLYLGSLTSIPEGFNPTVSGYLYLRSLTSIPEGFNPIVGGNLYLSSLTLIPEGFNPTVGGYLNLRSLTSIPEGFNPTVGGSLDLNSLTSIPEGFNPTVGGFLDLRSLTSLPEGFNPTVGNYIVSNIDIPFTKLDTSKPIYWESNDKKYIKVDGIFSEVINERDNVIKVRNIGSTKNTYIVTDGEKYAHGDSIKEAQESLIFKITDQDSSEFKNLDTTEPQPISTLIQAYRTITGACEFGVKNFIQRKNLEMEKKYPINHIIKLTKNEYGHQQFKEFFT